MVNGKPLQMTDRPEVGDYDRESRYNNQYCLYLCPPFLFDISENTNRTDSIKLSQHFRISSHDAQQAGSVVLNTISEDIL